MRFVFTAIAVCAALSGARSADAFGPHRKSTYNKQAAIGAYGRAVYPKYNLGIHVRELQNIGVPHGDVGILGSGLSRDPW